MFGFKKQSPTNLSIESQLKILAENGIHMLPDRTIDELLISFDRESFESPPFTLLLNALGSEVENEPWDRRFSDNVWCLDTECIEVNGDYVRLAKALQELTGGELSFQNLRDHVDIDADSAWIELELNGQPHRFEPEVQDDWVDPAIFAWFVELFAKTGSNRRFTCLDFGGQECLIGCATEEQLKSLRKATGLDFLWLT